MIVFEEPSTNERGIEAEPDVLIVGSRLEHGVRGYRRGRYPGVKADIGKDPNVGGEILHAGAMVVVRVHRVQALSAAVGLASEVGKKETGKERWRGFCRSPVPGRMPTGIQPREIR